jgi:hypothetical protein
MIAYGSSNLNRLDVSFADWLREYDHKRMARLCQLRPVVLVWPLKADRLETSKTRHRTGREIVLIAYCPANTGETRATPPPGRRTT